MFDKLKSYANAIAVGVILVLSSLLYALFNREKKQDAELAGLRGELLLKGSEEKFKEAEHDADAKERDYRDKLNAYKNATKSSTDK